MDKRNDDRKAANESSRAGEASAEAEDGELLRQFEEMTLAAAQAAKDYRLLMLEHMKVSMTAALSYVNGLSAAASSAATAAHDDPSTQDVDAHQQDTGANAAPPGKVADQYRAKAFELMTANMSAALETAQKFARAKTPSEFVELATGQARKQLELIVKQTSEFGSLAQKLTPRDIASMTGTFAKPLGDSKE